MRMPFMKHFSWYLIMAMFIIGISPKVDAGFSPSELMAVQQTDRASDLEKIRKVLEVKAVSERLGQLGLSQAEIQQRLSKLSDLQIHQAALQLDDLKIGGGDALGVIIAVLVIAVLVIVILKLTGHRVIVS
jgi:hypothetical protein